jgi:hypothetical protein
MDGQKSKIFHFSPDNSENPLWAGVQPTKIVTDSGTMLPENA